MHQKKNWKKFLTFYVRKKKLVENMARTDSRYGAPHSTLLQAEEKRARNPVPKCFSKLLEPAIGRSAGWSSLKGHFGTELHARFFCRMQYRWLWGLLGWQVSAQSKHKQRVWKYNSKILRRSGYFSRCFKKQCKTNRSSSCIRWFIPKLV